MRFDTVEDIYTAKREIRAVLLQTIADVSEDEAATVLPGEKWSIGNIAEHLAMVDKGISRICMRLVAEAKREGKLSAGPPAVSPRFWELSKTVGEVKVEAPEQVQPTGKMSVREAIEMLQDNRPAFESFKDDLNALDVSGPKFPHPYFGDLTAIEWLILCGGHEARHTRQIERLLSQIRQ